MPEHAPCLRKRRTRRHDPPTLPTLNLPYPEDAV